MIADGQEAAPGRAPARPAHVDVNARFLYGAPGAGLQTQGEARLRVDPNPFPQFKDYRWGDQQTPFEEKFVELGQTVTDGDGHATLAFAATDAGDTAQPLKALFTASVFEPGGRPVREGLILKVRTGRSISASRSTRATIAAGGDPTVSFDVIAVDPSAARIAAPGVN